MSHVLVVDDEVSICWGLKRLLGEAGHEVEVASSAEDAIEVAKSSPPELVFMDVRLPGMDGLSAMQELRAVAGEVPIIIITAFGNLETAVHAVRNGAFDYLAKPFDLEQAAAITARALAPERRKLAKQPQVTADQLSGEELLGSSAAMQEVFKRIALVANTDCSVLITGESGTGKELVARAIHRHSGRASRPLIPVNLASLSPTLVESELFGHMKGAFTGAEVNRQGLLELADGATVFFDEAADIPPSVQVKLLRVLEQHEVTPVGDTQPRPSNFRAIAATNHDLRQDFSDGFRQDLYYRLAVFDIQLPPLRQRPEDIPLLAESFLGRLRRSGVPETHFTRAALAELCRRDWPGNVRELRNAVEHGALIARGSPIVPEHLPPPAKPDGSASVNLSDTLQQAVRRWATAQLTSGETGGDLYQQFLNHAEPPLFEAVLDSTFQNRAAAADVLGIHRATLRKKMH